MDKDFFEWKTIYETGISRIDEQHKVIIKILNELNEIIIEGNKKDKLDEIIQKLVDYTDYHFKEEEIIFDKYNHPDKEAHIKEHRKFIAKVNEMKSELNNKENYLELELLSFLSNWLTEHILVTDKKYGQYFKKNNIII